MQKLLASTPDLPIAQHRASNLTLASAPLGRHELIFSVAFYTFQLGNCTVEESK